MNIRNILVGTSLLIILTMIVIIIIKVSNNPKDSGNKIPADTKNPPPQKQQVAPLLFSDYPDGKITKYFDLSNGGGWKVLGEKGQRIFIKTPLGDTLVDEHGVNHVGPKTRSGTFTFWVDKDHPGALGIKPK